MAQPQRKATSRDWPFQVTPLHDALGVEISGITLAQAVEPKMFDKVYEAFLDYELILFRDVDLPPATQVAFARAFGEVQIHVMNQYHGAEHPEIYKLSNVDAQGRPNGKHPDKGTMYWHTDGSWRERTGQATMMYSEVVPPVGGETEFADLRAAHDALPPAMKEKIDSLVAEHSIFYSRGQLGHTDYTEAERAALPSAHHRLVRVHPGSRRKTLYMGAHASHIVGWPMPDGRLLLRDLMEHATQREFVHRHSWLPGDLVIWDNRCTLHRGRPYDDAAHPRDLRRVTTRDPGSVLGQVA